MSALRQPNFTHEYYSPRTLPKNIGHQTTEVITQPPVKPTTVVKPGTFSPSNVLPHNLKILSLLQKGSFGLALASMTASIGLYISTVQIPKLWSQEYQNLKDLQSQERQMTAINETIKYQIAQEAGEDTSLSISTPESAIFILPAKVNPKTHSKTLVDQQKIVQLKHSSLGY